MPKKFRWAVAKGAKGDPQQFRVYRMEKEALNGTGGYGRLPLNRLRAFLRVLCRRYGVPYVKVQYKDLGEWGAEYDNGTISFDRNKRHALTTMTAAHEFAHHLHGMLDTENEDANHGPEWVMCYMSVLDTARIIPAYAFKAVCDHYKVRYVDPGKALNDPKQFRTILAKQRAK